MPRILPRLIKRVAQNNKPLSKSWKPFILPRQSPKSLFKPVPPRPSFHPAHYKQSILLAPSETNPITSSRVYTHHKTLPPRARLSGRVKTRPGQYDRPREMTSEERSWWSSPYLRMLASPIRRCIASERYLPMDFLVRLARMRVPQSLQFLHGKQILIPDGLQHSKFTTRRSGTASYILCSKEAVSIMAKRNAKKFSAHNISTHSLLADQIAHLLRVRVLQELELLGDQMESLVGRSGSWSGTRIIRRLSRGEWNSIRAKGLIPYPKAVAVIVVPPLQKDPVTGKRPEPSMSTSPIIEEDTLVHLKPPLPISVLHPLIADENEFPIEHDILPREQIPLYNGVALFPARPQRAALHTLLTRLLSIERRSRHSVVPNPERLDVKAVEDKRASHAFLLSSDADTAKRGDVAAVAIALWRVRMFEHGTEDQGSGWVRGQQT